MPQLRMPASGTVMLLSLIGCAGYSPVPLPDSDGLLLDAQILARELPASAPVRIEDGLDMDEAAVVAVALNPDLLAQRRRLDVAGAQLFATRLLPDPQLGASIDHPTTEGPGLVDAGTASLNLDLLALLTRGPRIDAQRLARDQVRLDLVWQEWQVAQQARMLVVRERAQAAKLALLDRAVEGFEKRQAASDRALRDGNLTIESAGPDLTALLDAASQRNQLRQQQNQTDHDLHALLGLRPEARLDMEPLADPPPAAGVDSDAVMAGVIRTRPDLLALQAGYASQEARIRLAVMQRFPSLGIGFTRARDTSAIYTSGAGISLDLPLFSGNRGNLRIERATREQLRAEYQARLAQTRIDVERLVRERSILDRHRAFLARHLPGLEHMVTEAEAAYARRDIDALVYLNLALAAIGKRMELIDLEQSLWEIAIALDTITAGRSG